MRILAIGLSAALLAAAPAMADTAPAKDEAAKVASKTKAKPPEEVDANGEKLICRKEEVIGSILPKRVCRTQAQIEADKRAAEQFGQDRNQLGTRGQFGR